MTYCLKCHRPMKHATPSGFGPVCGKREKAAEAVERDLFGFDISRASEAASRRVRSYIEILALDALMDLKHEAAAARRRLGVWS